MHSFLIVGGDKAQRDTNTEKLCSQRMIHHLDVTLLSVKNSENDSQTIGIQEVRQLQKALCLQPMKSTIKAAVISECQALTDQAQHALLKLLEEPPKHTIIILTADTKDSLLPTVVSRCFLVELKKEEKDASSKLSISAAKAWQAAAQPPASLLRIANDFGKKKEDAQEFLAQCIRNERKQLVNGILQQKPQGTTLEKKKEQLHMIKKMQRAYMLVKSTNVNTRLVLENLLLSLCLPLQL